MATIFKRTYAAKRADGTVITRKCRHYTIEYSGRDGKRCRHKGYTDRGATEQLAARLEKAIARGAEGLVDQYREHKARRLADHVADYISDLTVSGCDQKYVANIKLRLGIIIAGCGWTCLGDVDANTFVRFREHRRLEKRKGTRKDLVGASAQTLNQYLEAARSFLNWCASVGRVESVASGSRKVSTLLAGVTKVEGEKVRKRRALTDDQVANLLAVAPADRAIVYRLALAVGLRRQELVDVKWGDVHLSAIPPFIQLRAEATKARRGDRVYLPQTLADDLRAQRAGASDNNSVFPHVPSLELWKKDIKAAGIPWADEMGRRADFHGGTRKTLCSRMQRNGVPLAVAMRTMRHTDAKLTMVDYVDDGQIGLGNVLPEVSASAATPPAARTGT